MSDTKVRKLAGELYEALETRKRDNGNEFTCLADNSPAWMTEVIRAVHGDKLPDDTTYSMIQNCADAIQESEDEPYDAVASIEPDIYTHALTGWLHARADHIYYLTEALEQGPSSKDGGELLMFAQSLQIQEVGTALISALDDADTPEDTE